MGTRITVTGPRSHKLYGKDMNNDNNLNFVKYCVKHLSRRSDVTEVNIGMATGVDILFGLAVLYYAKEKNIKLHCYIPGTNQTKHYTDEEKEIYNHILKKADHVYHLTEEECTPKVLKDRNKKMIKECDEVLSFWNYKRYKSGTWSAIRQAQKKGKPIYNINPFDPNTQGYLS